jgi:tetratricopeptide (TPR) repeat protein
MSSEYLTWPDLLTLIRACEEPDRLLTDFLLRQIETCKVAPECRLFAEMIETGEVDPDDLCIFTVGMAHSRRKVNAIWPEIEPLDAEWARRRVLREPPRWAMVERLVEQSAALSGVDADKALALAELAVEIAERLPVRLPNQSYPEDMDEVPFDEDAQLEALALAYAARANVYRVGERYVRAEKEFQRVDRLGIEWPTLGFYSRVCSLRASLHYDRRHFDLALDALAEAEAALRSPAAMATDAAQLRIRIQRIMLLGTTGRLPEALELSTTTLSERPAPQENRLSLALLHAHVDVISRIGDAAMARKYVPQLTELCRAVGTPTDRLRINWVLARLDFATGRTAEALRGYGEVAEGWLERKLPDRWALVLVETALVHLERGEVVEAQRLASSALPTLMRLSASPDVFAILKLLATAKTMTHAHLSVLLRKLEFATRSGAPSP